MNVFLMYAILKLFFCFADAGHRVIGRGFVRAPIQCFEVAKAAFEKKYHHKL